LSLDDNVDCMILDPPKMVLRTRFHLARQQRKLRRKHLKIVVTGGSGFLGSTLAVRLLEEGHDVTCVDVNEPGAKGGLMNSARFVRGDVRDKELLRKLFDGADEIYHIAGLLGTSELQTRITEAIEVNILSSVSVFEIATEMNVPRLFYPVKPSVWLNTYTITKAAAEQFARMFNEYGKTRICALRYFNGFGPGQALLPIRKIIPAFAVQAMRGRPIEIFGDGDQSVDMVYSKDIAEVTIRFLRAGHTASNPDCGSGESMTVNEVAASVNDYFGNKAGVTYLPMRAGETESTQIASDMTELVSILGPLPITPYRTALDETLAWYAEQDAALIDKTMKFFGWQAGSR